MPTVRPFGMNRQIAGGVPVPLLLAMVGVVEAIARWRDQPSEGTVTEAVHFNGVNTHLADTAQPARSTRIVEHGATPSWNHFHADKQYTNDVDDAALLRRACNGDEAGFCELFARYERRIYQYASHMCGTVAGDDIVQETFLAVLKPGGFDASKGTVAGYLFGIARHAVIRLLAKQGTLLEPSDNPYLDVAAPEDTPFEIMVREQTVAAVREAVESLPPLYREVVVLCDLQEMDYAMAAGVIQCPIGTVRSRLHRARALLATTLRLDLPGQRFGCKHGS
jgi:RNA polymerase sigma-70 factor (ECF subfamily)